MSRTKKADHRLVQPTDEDYVEHDGTRIFVGPYTVEQRAAYMQSHISLAQTRFPDMTPAKARDAAFHKWRNVVIATIQDRAHVESK